MNRIGTLAKAGGIRFRLGEIREAVEYIMGRGDLFRLSEGAQVINDIWEEGKGEGITYKDYVWGEIYKYYLARGEGKDWGEVVRGGIIDLIDWRELRESLVKDREEMRFSGREEEKLLGYFGWARNWEEVYIWVPGLEGEEFLEVGDKIYHAMEWGRGEFYRKYSEEREGGLSYAQLFEYNKVIKSSDGEWPEISLPSKELETLCRVIKLLNRIIK